MESLFLNPFRLSVALGVLWGCLTLLLGFVAAFLRRGTAWVELIGLIYLGYRPTLYGSLIGGIWGFVDGFLSGLLISWLYRLLRG